MIWTIFVGLLAVCALADLACILLWYSCAYPNSQVLGPALVRGRTHERHIALTFDDGPHPSCTNRVLDILQQNRTPATFFMCGRNVMLYPEILKRALVEGHTIGNHTYSHPYLYGLPRTRIGEEIEKTQAAIFQVAGLSPKFFRPPYGARWFGLYPTLKRIGLTLVQWSDACHDWELPSDRIVENILNNLRPGAVIVLHDGIQASGGFLRSKFRKAAGDREAPGMELESNDRSAMVAALPPILRGATEMGFKFVALDEFLPIGVQGRHLATKIRHS